MEQRSQEWFEARIGRVTGSVAGAILGLSPWMKRSDVMRAMVRAAHGAPSEFTGNVATEYGSFHERFAIMDFEMATGKSVQPVGFVPYQDWLGASPDGLIDDDAILEVKCPYGLRDQANPVFKTAAEQPHYFAQMQIEMICTNRHRAYFWQWTPHATNLEIVERDPLFDLEPLHDFHKAYLAAVQEPDRYLCDRLSSAEALKLSQRYLELVALESEKDEIRARLIEMADGEKTNIGDLLVYPVNKSGSISYAKAIKALCPDADLTPYTGKPSTSWVIKC